MTFNEAVALQPQWVQIWLNILMLGVVVSPALMIIFKETRWFGLGFVVSSLVLGGCVVWLYHIDGYTRILGLPHLFVWIPAAVLIWRKLPQVSGLIPRILLIFTLVTISISLAFDVVDVTRYVLGDRASMIPG